MFILFRNWGLSFVAFDDRELDDFFDSQGLNKTFVECDERIWRVGNK
jgi:hypothetical protein